ncbi:HepT-like ribonuclease domain-containing protein [Olivibacter sitiensis]|uniref:HepT-like ribonuclease domain-containing protein n=1 Tax=Olivibacter sitiensis TaxID=376470 RepID=UPI000481C8AA|nr:HepT-like ribonuclease domain-containing protein [Olivibacter sitiensis]
MRERDIRLWLVDIDDAIKNILEFTREVDDDTFGSSLKVKHAVLHNFAVIGEAVSKLSDAFKAAHTEIAWREIKGFRNYVVHEYFGLDDGIIWEIIQNDLPQLQRDINRILEAENKKGKKL